MKSRLLAFAAAVLLALPAAAQFKTIQLAHEVQLSQLRLPGTDAGTIGFKPCEACEYQTERVSADTVYVINDRPVTLKEFSDRLSRVNDRSNTFVTVLHHLEDDVVSRVSVQLR